MPGQGLPGQAAPIEGGGWSCRELCELIEATVRPLLREQEQSLSRCMRAMLETYCSASGPSGSSAHGSAERPARSPCRVDRFGCLGPLGHHVPDSPEFSRPKSPDQRAQGVKSLEDARGREILCGMTRQSSGVIRQRRSEQEPKTDDGDLPFSPARSVEDMLGLPGPRPAHARASPRGDGRLGGWWPRPSGALHALQRRLAPAHGRAPLPVLLDLCGPAPASAAGPGNDVPPRGPGLRSGRGHGGPRQCAPAPERLGQPELPSEGLPGPTDLPGGPGPPGEWRAEALGRRGRPSASGVGGGPAGEADGAMARADGAGGRVHVHLTREEVGGSAGRLGVEALEATAGAERGIRVTAIHEDGLVALWNARRAEGRLRVGDVIVEVNGQTEDLASFLSQAFARGEPLHIIAAVPEGAARPGDSAARERGLAAGVLALPIREAAVDVGPQGPCEQHGADPSASSPCVPAIPPSCGTGLSGGNGGSTGAGAEPTQECCGCRIGTSSRFTQEGAEPTRRMSRGGSGGPPLPQPDASDRATHGGGGGSKGPPPQLNASEQGLNDICEWSLEGCQSEPLRRIVEPTSFSRQVSPESYSSSVSRSSRRKCSKSSLGLPTVQTVRHQREDGLVEAMVQDQDWLNSDGSFCVLDSPDADGYVSAPLWLRICGTLPWGQRAADGDSALLFCYRPLVLASMALILCFLALTAVYAPAGSCEHATCLSHVQVADLALAVGSLLGLLAVRSLSSLGILGNSESVLVAYARRQEITAAWSAAMRCHSARLAFLWVCSVSLRFASLMRGPRPSLLDAATAGGHAVASLVFLGIVSGILHVSCALTMVIDSYTTHFDGSCFSLDTSVHEWNLLQAVLRKVSGAAERGFMAVQSTAGALVTGVILAARGQLSGEPVGAGDVAWLSSTALLVVGAMFVFFKAAEVSERCVRMPSVVNSLNFGECVDARRHYLVEFMSYSAAGFYVWEVRITSAIALKLTYFCCILAFAGLSQLYAEDF